MGNKKSSFDDNDDGERKFRTAASTVGTLATHTDHSSKEEKRAKLIATIERMKREKEMACLAMERVDSTDLSRFKRRNTSVDSDSLQQVNINEEKHDDETFCHLCKKLALADGYLCRVCDRVFHKHCLEKSGQCRSIDLELLPRAHTNIGWSCYICGNLCLLLSDDEMNQIIEKFDALDTDKDSCISWAEYEKHRSYLYSSDGNARGITEREIEWLHLDFKLADVNADGQLDWWEFVNHDAKILLMKRRKEDLVQLLTHKEVKMARDMFSALDRDSDGNVNELEAREAFSQFYKNYSSAGITSAPNQFSTSDVTNTVVCTILYAGYC
ncbi:PHD finger protein 24-like isoform X2 [Gigantopelta aegis]|uniref:PHD finger protein 24-like isoform X2 n=1 Tax=Gigantopelta aegis TaxID=1735272 RepID=UPI001B88BE99|nr:PHD finger protein 24-like isoform X2 [Gigantopelta aegis]